MENIVKKICARSTHRWLQRLLEIPKWMKVFDALRARLLFPWEYASVLLWVSLKKRLLCYHVANSCAGFSQGHCTRTPSYKSLLMNRTCSSLWLAFEFDNVFSTIVFYAQLLKDFFSSITRYLPNISKHPYLDCWQLLFFASHETNGFLAHFHFWLTLHKTLKEFNSSRVCCIICGCTIVLVHYFVNSGNRSWPLSNAVHTKIRRQLTAVSEKSKKLTSSSNRLLFSIVLRVSWEDNFAVPCSEFFVGEDVASLEICDTFPTFLLNFISNKQYVVSPTALIQSATKISENCMRLFTQLFATCAVFIP